jgi:hypothetical protein
MKLALTVWENRSSPLLGCACIILLVDIVDSTETSGHYEPLRYELPFFRAVALLGLGVSVLICASNVADHYGMESSAGRGWGVACICLDSYFAQYHQFGGRYNG